jgi:hypothetical protein
LTAVKRQEKEMNIFEDFPENTSEPELKSLDVENGRYWDNTIY